MQHAPTWRTRELGLITLEWAIDGRLIDASLRKDCERSLDGLQRLADSLLEAEDMPQHELLHSSDALIAPLIQRDGAALAHLAQGSDHALNRLRCHSRERRPSLRRHGHRAVAASLFTGGLS